VDWDLYGEYSLKYFSLHGLYMGLYGIPKISSYMGTMCYIYIYIFIYIYSHGIYMGSLVGDDSPPVETATFLFFKQTACGSAATSSTKEQGSKRCVRGFKKCSLAWYLYRAFNLRRRIFNRGNVYFTSIRIRHARGIFGVVGNFFTCLAMGDHPSVIG